MKSVQRPIQKLIQKPIWQIQNTFKILESDEADEDKEEKEEERGGASARKMQFHGQRLAVAKRCEAR